MGFLDKMKDTAQQVTDKARDLGETGKDKVGELQLKRKVEGLEREIGALVVARRRGSAPDDADALIDAKVAEIAAAEEEIARQGAKRAEESGPNGDAGGPTDGTGPSDTPTA